MNQNQSETEMNQGICVNIQPININVQNCELYTLNSWNHNKISQNIK